MKPRLSLIFIIIFLTSLTGFTQKIIINGEETDRKLTWSDFTGKVDKNSQYFAYTGFRIGYKVENIKVIGDSINIGKFEVTLELDPVKSWANKSKTTDDLLIHEQGHFDMGILSMREIVEVYKKTRFTRSNLNSTIENIISTTQKKYNEMQLKYDAETDHSKNKDQQVKWNQFIAEQLTK